jgi:hypothetical protein
MLHAAIAVVAGYVVWSLVWVGANATIFAAAAAAAAKGERIDHAPTLAGMLVTSILCSVLAGAVCGRIREGARASLVLGLALLLTGAGVQYGARDLMPMWYHGLFLVLLVPVTMLAARVAARPGSRSAAR